MMRTSPQFIYENTGEIFGISAQVNLYGCNENISDPKMIEKYVVTLCELIEMKRYGDPVIVCFGDDIEVKGYSLVQLIETSLISGHFVDHHKTAYLDIFSCKKFNPHLVANFSAQHFGAESKTLEYQFRKKYNNEVKYFIG